jgi:phage-related protein
MSGDKYFITDQGFTKKTQKTPKKEIDKAVRTNESVL